MLTFKKRHATTTNDFGMTSWCFFVEEEVHWKWFKRNE